MSTIRESWSKGLALKERKPSALTFKWFRYNDANKGINLHQSSLLIPRNQTMDATFLCSSVYLVEK